MSKKKVLFLLVLALVLVLTACEEDISQVNEDYTLEAEVLAGSGRIELEPDKDSYESGTEVEVKAQAETGYEFDSWSGTLSGQDNPAEIVVDDDLTIGAKFSLKEAVDKVEIMGSGQGTVVASEDEDGDEVYVPKAEEGSYFVGWKDGKNIKEVDVDNEAGYLLTEGHYVAIFAKIRGNFAIDSEHDNGKVELEPDKEEYSSGDTVTIKAKADIGYAFTGWQGDIEQLDEAGIKSPKLTLVIGEDIEEDEVIGLHPNFARQAGELTLDKEGEGEIELSPEQDEYKVGDKVELTAEADDTKGYKFKQWSGDIEDADKEEKEIEVEIKEAMNITAEFEKKSYEVEFIDHEGEIETQEVEHGEDAVAPDVREKKGYYFVEWDQEFNNVTSDLVVNANFAKQSGELILDKEGEGEIELSPEQEEYKVGDKVELTAEADEGWVFSHWSGDIGDNDKEAKEIEVEIKENMNITAEFEKKTYEVTFEDSEGDEIETQTVKYGESAEAPKYDSSAWNIDFNDVTSDLTVKLNTYEVEFKDHEGSSIEAQEIEHGKSAVAPDQPSREGYKFIGWNNSFDNVTTDISILAKYEKNSIASVNIEGDKASGGGREFQWYLISSGGTDIKGISNTSSVPLFGTTNETFDFREPITKGSYFAMVGNEGSNDITRMFTFYDEEGKAVSRIKIESLPSRDIIKSSDTPYIKFYFNGESVSYTKK